MAKVSAETLRATRARLGRAGVVPQQLLGAPIDEARELARGVEALGYRSLWVGEGLAGRDAFALHGILLAATSSLVTGAGIANIWARVPGIMEGGGAALGEAYPGRFLLGVGVSHSTYIEQAAGVSYGRPLEKARAYLDAMDQAAGAAPRVVPRLLAALRPRMLEVAGTLTDGALPYLVTVEHTEQARAVLGPDSLLIPAQLLVVDSDPGRARQVARKAIARYLTLPNYVNSLRTLGFTDDDLAAPGSDRLIDALVAWGSPESIADRVTSHLDAGADHVLLQPLGGDSAAALGQLEALAPVVLA